MSVEQRDKYTGHMTTGHDWNGIKELNTKVPKLLLACLALAFLFSIAYWYLLPAWPLGRDYTKGKLNIDQKQEVQSHLLSAQLDMANWTESLATSNLDESFNNAKLMSVVADSGPALFGDNCAMCHGQKGEGNLYYPRLSDTSWLWGGKPSQIQQTLLVGINADVEKTRVSVMPAFGSTGALQPNEIEDIATYLQSLSTAEVGSGSRAGEVLSVARGATAYSANCVACHGTEGKGNTLLGAPNLTDDYWLYGGDKVSISESIFNGRGGRMPAWKNRLNESQIRILSLYVANLSRGDNGPNLDEKVK